MSNSTISAGTIVPAAGGKILQVVSANKTDTQSIATATMTDVTSLSAAITPSSTSNKVLVTCYISVGPSNGSYQQRIDLLRGSTVLNAGAAAGSRRVTTTFIRAEHSTEAQQNVCITFLDSPATTSATTYKIQTGTHGAGTVYINRSPADSNDSNHARAGSSIVLMEVDGT